MQSGKQQEAANRFPFLLPSGGGRFSSLFPVEIFRYLFREEANGTRFMTTKKNRKRRGRQVKKYLSVLPSRQCCSLLSETVGGIYAISAVPRDRKRDFKRLNLHRAQDTMFKMCNRLEWFLLPLNFGRCALRESEKSQLVLRRSGDDDKENYNKTFFSRKSNRLSRCDNAWMPYWQNILVSL